MIRDTKVKRLFCLIGMCSSGKNTILEEVVKYYDGKIQPVVSTTSRPMRDGEIEGKDYYFISNAEFFEKSTDFVEQRVYHTKVEEDGVVKDATWRYGIERSELDKGDYLMVIVDPQGHQSLKKYLGNNKVIPIFVNVPKEQLEERALKRGDDKAEVTRRLEDDYKAFIPFRVNVVYEEVKNSNGQLEDAVIHTISIINKHIEQAENIASKSKRKGK